MSSEVLKAGGATRGVTWEVGESIVHELELVLDHAGGLDQSTGRENPEPTRELRELVDAVPPDWLRAWHDLELQAGGSLAGLIPGAALAGTLYGGDYSAATLPIRELTLKEALRAALTQAVAWDLAPEEELTDAEQLTDLLVRLKLRLFTAAGVEWASHERQAQVLARSMSVVPRILRGGDLHSRFWHLLDRFYYEAYAGWRSARETPLEESERRAVERLGGPSGTGYPNTDWLSSRNPLLNYPELSETIRTRNLHIYFMVEPIGLQTFIGVQPDTIIVSCSQVEVGLEEARAFAEDMVDRLKALADPSRILILGLISSLSLSNTQMGNYLGLSRSTVSIHTKLLREAGLINSHSDGRTTKHTLNPDAILDLFARLQYVLDITPGETGEARKSHKGSAEREDEAAGPVL